MSDSSDDMEFYSGLIPENFKPISRSVSVIYKIKNARIAFCQNLFTPGKFAGSDEGEAAYSSTFLIPKNSPQVKEINDLIDKVAADKWGAKAAGILKTLRSTGKTCFNDGEAKAAQYQGFEGTMYISARSVKKPLVIDQNRLDLTKDSGKPYAGAWVNASIDLWAMDNKFGKRICATLRAVQFVKDDTAFAGSAPATADEFDDVSDIGDDLL